MDLYTIETEYVDYLKQFQERIWENDDKGKLRPYAGVVLHVGNNNYYVPLSSPKPKHMKMKDRLDFIRLEQQKQLKAVLNLNNMIPVHKSLVERIVINKITNPVYRELLHRELLDIKRKQATIQKNAIVIYNKTTKYRDEPQNQRLVSVCYDFLLLEQKLQEYMNKRG
jgi:protein AbiQ